MILSNGKRKSMGRKLPMISDLEQNKVLLSYDNPCQTRAKIEIDPRKISAVVRECLKSF